MRQQAATAGYRDVRLCYERGEMSDNGVDIGDAMQYILAGGAGVVGQIMRHMHMIQTGNRKPWLWTFFDMGIALGIGWIVLGLGDWFSVPFKATQSLAILAGWGGPHLMDALILRAIEKFFVKPGGKQDHT